MKRRAFTAGMALAVLAPAIARAKPGNLVETPGLAEQVKSGGLPAVGKRIPEVPSVVKHFSGSGRPRPLGRTGQHPDRQRARYAPDDALLQCAADRLRRPVQAPVRHPRELRGQGRQRVHPEAARRPQMVRRRAVHDRGFPLLLGRHRQQQGAVAGRTECRADGRRQAAQGRDHRSADHQVHLGQAQPLLHREPGARRSAVPVPAGALPQEIPREVHAGRRDRQGGQGRPGEAGCRSTAAST